MTVLGIRSQILWNSNAYRKMITLSIDVQSEPENNNHTGFKPEYSTRVHQPLTVPASYPQPSRPENENSRIIHRDLSYCA